MSVYRNNNKIDLQLTPVHNSSVFLRIQMFNVACLFTRDDNEIYN